MTLVKAKDPRDFDIVQTGVSLPKSLDEELLRLKRASRRSKNHIIVSFLRAAVRGFRLPVKKEPDSFVTSTIKLPRWLLAEIDDLAKAAGYGGRDRSEAIAHWLRWALEEDRKGTEKGQP